MIYKTSGGLKRGAHPPFLALFHYFLSTEKMVPPEGENPSFSTALIYTKYFTLVCYCSAGQLFTGEKLAKPGKGGHPLFRTPVFYIPLALLALPLVSGDFKVQHLFE